ncbi:MAG TPA: alpha/beta hydrolase, partial [Chloroflexota bacterium]
MADNVVEVRGVGLAYSELAPGAAGVPAAARAGAAADALAGAGAGAHGTFVLVHGLGSSRHIWDLVAPTLATRFRVLALDQRGHGESDKPDDGYDFPSIVADLFGFLERLAPAQPVVLVGHSWGASVVLHVAVQHPERIAGLVLVDGGTSSPGERSTWDETLERLTPPDIDGMRWADLRRRMSARNGMYEDPRVEAVGRSLFNFDADGRIYRRLKIPNHLRILRALWEQRPAELLPQVRAPLLLLPARQSADAGDWSDAKARSIQRALELQPRARLRWFEDTVHDIPLHRPDELAAELVAFADSSFSGAATPTPDSTAATLLDAAPAHPDGTASTVVGAAAAGPDGTASTVVGAAAAGPDGTASTVVGA